jgi:hypothetical protein
VTWTKLSDDFGEDCWALSDEAFRLHVEGLLWSNSKLLDCRIPKDDLRRFAKRPDALTELLDAGWWSDDGDGFVINHHSEKQPTRDQVIAFRQKQSANGRKGGRPRKRPAENPVANPQANPVEKPGGRDGTGQGKDGLTRGEVGNGYVERDFFTRPWDERRPERSDGERCSCGCDWTVGSAAHRNHHRNDEGTAT